MSLPASATIHRTRRPSSTLPSGKTADGPTRSGPVPGQPIDRRQRKTRRCGHGPYMTARTTVTDEGGAYRFSAVPIGNYTGQACRARRVRNDRPRGHHVGLGFAASVDAELRQGTVTDGVTVRRPVVDGTSTAITTHFDSETLAALPGARDIFAVLGQHARHGDRQDGRGRRGQRCRLKDSPPTAAGDHRHASQRG